MWDLWGLIAIGQLGLVKRVGGEVWVGLGDFVGEDGAEGVVGREGVGEDAYA